MKDNPKKENIKDWSIAQDGYVPEIAQLKESGTKPATQGSSSKVVQETSNRTSQSTAAQSDLSGIGKTGW